ncbi:DUF6493 family protein [Streptomyces sp. NPDC026672]|uniref:DUF7824 domain-containing protein n=1 Tax=unclassified Streptomyces TaxID=2593676 RepID=UPI0033D90DD0
MSELMEAVRAGRTDSALRLVAALPDGERRAFLPELRELRKEMRSGRWDEYRRVGPALHAVGAACHTGAAAAAGWLAASDLRWRQASPAALLRAVEGRDAGWLADVAHRLAARPVSADVPFELMSGLVRRAGCAVPVTDAYVVGWMRHVRAPWGRDSSVLDGLRGEPDLAPLVAGLFELTDLGEVRWLFGSGPGSWQNALVQLTREGALDRGTVLDACVARLVRGGGPSDHRVFLPLLELLDLTHAERVAHIADWAALARDAASPVAAHAQSVLAGLALDGDLTPRRLAEVSDGVLFRPEKKLVRAQLVLLGKVLVRDRSAAPELLPAVGRAFGHEDGQMQERAVKLLERHAKHLAPDDAARDELAFAVEQLGPALRSRAGSALGIQVTEADLGVEEEVLPPAPEPARLAQAPRSSAELAEETGALLASGGDVAVFERVLDGLVRQAHRDVPALLEALAPVVERRWWASEAGGTYTERYFDGAHHDLHGTEDAVDLLLATLRGRVRTSTLHASVTRHAPIGQACAHRGLAAAFDARIREVAHRLRTDPLPLLLSTPTWSTGLLEPGELVDRLDVYRRLGTRVSRADFAQALLRVRRDDRPAALAAAERADALGTREGERLAGWLRAGEPAPPSAARSVVGTRLVVEFGEVPDLQEDFLADFARLGRPVGALAGSRPCGHWSHALWQHWLAVLPDRRELVAVRLLFDLARAAEDDGRGAVGVLPQLAESGGAAGECVHLCLGYGLGARHAEDRLAAVDALLVLAARGQLDPARLGADLGQLVRRGAVKPVRLAESVRTAAATGAHTTVWELLRHTLPVLLADLATGGPAVSPPAARGLGDLLAVAADCAERSGARGELPHLSSAAGRRGSSRLVTEARRLREALAEPVAA